MSANVMTGRLVEKSLWTPMLPPLAEPVCHWYAKVQWLWRLRWVAITCQIVILPLLLHYGLLAQGDVAPYLAVAGALVAFNGAAALLPSASEWALLGHMVVDLAALGSLLALTQGCANPVSALIYMHAAIGPLLLARWSSVMHLGATCACLMAYCLRSQPGFHGLHGQPLPHGVSLAAQLVVVAAIWGLTTAVAAVLARLRHEVEASRRQRQRSDHLKALGAMAAGFTHEFATPLNTAKVRLERLARQLGAMGSAAAGDDLSVAVAALDRCEVLVRGLYSSDLESGTVTFDPVDLGAWVATTCRRWQGARPEASLQLSVPEEPVPCLVPRTILARSLVDLLDNALEAMVPPAAVAVSLRVDQAQAVIEVADQGQGIAPRIQDQLGEPFVSTKPGGTGLGLYTASALMDALGGILAMRSGRGGGSIVAMAFPLQLPSAKP